MAAIDFGGLLSSDSVSDEDKARAWGLMESSMAQQERMTNASIAAANRGAEAQERVADAQRETAAMQTQAARNADQRAQERWDFYKNTYQPKELAFIQEAWAGKDPKKAVAAASLDVTSSFDKAAASQGRALASFGVDPSSGRFGAQSRQSMIAKAVSDAMARNATRTAIEDQNFAKRSQVVGMGLGLPQESVGMAATGSNVLAQASNSLSGASSATNAGTAGLLSAYGDALSAASNNFNQGMGLYGNIIDTDAQVGMNNANTRGEVMGAGIGALSQIAGTASGAALSLAGI